MALLAIDGQDTKQFFILTQRNVEQGSNAASINEFAETCMLLIPLVDSGIDDVNQAMMKKCLAQRRDFVRN